MANTSGTTLDDLLAAILAIAPQGSVVVDADGRTITVAESGSVYSNEGASAIAPFILPPAAASLNYSFIVQDADGIRVTAASGDTIRIAGTASGLAGKIENTTIGSTVKLTAINATEWIGSVGAGTWTVT